jgi:hypothetical protein
MDGTGAITGSSFSAAGSGCQAAIRAERFLELEEE